MGNENTTLRRGKCNRFLLMNTFLQQTAVRDVSSCNNRGLWFSVTRRKYYILLPLGLTEQQTSYSCVLTRSILSVHWKSSSTVRSFKPIQVLSWLRPAWEETQRDMNTHLQIESTYPVHTHPDIKRPTCGYSKCHKLLYPTRSLGGFLLWHVLFFTLIKTFSACDSLVMRFLLVCERKTQ